MKSLVISVIISALTIAGVRDTGPVRIVRNSSPGGDAPPIFLSIPPLSSADLNSIFSKGGVTRMGGAAPIHLDAQHFYHGPNNYLHAVAAEVDPHGMFIGLSAPNSAENMLLAYHQAATTAPFLVDFSVAPDTGSVTVQTIAPDGTKESATITSATHLPVLVIPSRKGMFGIGIQATHGMASVTAVDITNVASK